MLVKSATHSSHRRGSTQAMLRERGPLLPAPRRGAHPSVRTLPPGELGSGPGAWGGGRRRRVLPSVVSLPPVLEGFALNQDDIGLTPCAKSGSLLASSYRNREKGLVPGGTISLRQRVTRASEAGWKSACRSAHLDKGTGSLGIRGTTGALTIKDKIGKDTIRKPRLPF